MHVFFSNSTATMAVSSVMRKLRKQIHSFQLASSNESHIMLISMPSELKAVNYQTQLLGKYTGLCTEKLYLRVVCVQTNRNLISMHEFYYCIDHVGFVEW